MKKKAAKIWEFEDLPRLKTGDNLAFKAEGTLQEWQAKLIGAVTYHWGMVGERQVDDEYSTGDWSIFDSTSKGITAHLLSEYAHRHMRVYRPRLTPAEQRRLKPRILKMYLYYGDQKYDYSGVFMVAVWWLLRKMGFKIEWFVHNSNKFWCLEFNETVLRRLGFPLVPASEPPYPCNMERSDKLELIWGTF